MLELSTSGPDMHSYTFQNIWKYTVRDFIYRNLQVLQDRKLPLTAYASSG